MLLTMEQNFTEMDEDVFRIRFAILYIIIITIIFKNSFSFDSEEDTLVEPWYTIIRNFTCDDIQSFHTIFQEKVLRKKLCKSSETVGLTKEEFVNGIDEIFGMTTDA